MDHRPLLSLFREDNSIPPIASARILLAAHKQLFNTARALLTVPANAPSPPVADEVIVTVNYMDTLPMTDARVRAWTELDPALAKLCLLLLNGACGLLQALSSRSQHLQAYWKERELTRSFLERLDSSFLERIQLDLSPLLPEPKVKLQWNLVTLGNIPDFIPLLTYIVGTDMDHHLWLSLQNVLQPVTSMTLAAGRKDVEALEWVQRGIPRLEPVAEQQPGPCTARQALEERGAAGRPRETGSCLSLCLVAGLPGAGKSTFARRLQQVLQPKSESLLLCYDDLIPGEAFLVTGQADGDCLTDNPVATGSLWKLYRQKLLVYIECLLQALFGNGYLSVSGSESDSMWECFIQSLKQQHIISEEIHRGVQQYSVCNTCSRPLVIILDDNFYYQSMRYEVYQIARRNSLGFFQLFLECPVELCLQRNRERGCLVNDETIRLMSAKVQLPDPEKNSWEKASLIMKSAENVLEEDIQKVFELLDVTLENPEKPFEENIAQKCGLNAVLEV
ncbi:L-seryl-tRNA(Sec) kinase-like [Scyliorhinus canicula]|uniref:L-seryl-tRNA(Sec) kinase-like n=1 Tax=Scyliorhinus canicula TaxID=7830 RepID=UPI0018F51323|nr:L-seryl-tRNA(Sec) kinase-like [Scyliorhinus canicula]